MKKRAKSASRPQHSSRIRIRPLGPNIEVADLIENYYNAYNAARLREICRLMEAKILQKDVTVGVTLAGALTPAGFTSFLVPLMERGFIDWIVATGANVYHDLQRGLGYEFHRGSPFVDDVKLFQERLIRIYDIIVDFDSLLESDRYLYRLIDQRAYQKKMATSELHWLLGKDLDRLERKTGRVGSTLLAAAYRCDVPIYTSSPGDSTIGMNVAARALLGGRMEFDVSLDVNETTAIVHEAKVKGKSAVVILGGGSPKNFILQTEPQLQEILGLDLTGHDYYVQITDARPDTGGLSGATPSEAVSWGKVDPDKLPDAIVCYSDTTLAFPLVASYMISRCRRRALKRLYGRRTELVTTLKQIVRARSLSGQRSLRGTILEKKAIRPKRQKGTVKRRPRART
jgi:deoxyhypusine synthase